MYVYMCLFMFTYMYMYICRNTRTDVRTHVRTYIEQVGQNGISWNRTECNATSTVDSKKYELCLFVVLLRLLLVGGRSSSDVFAPSAKSRV